MLRVAIGPLVQLPSWNWIGFELRELSKYFGVQVFTWEDAAKPPACDILLAVKFLHRRFLEVAKVLYMPVDLYASPAAVELQCAAAGAVFGDWCHAEPLLPLFGRHCRQVFFVEHHAELALPELASYKERGFVLWVGAFEHVPYLLAWCQRHPLPLPLVIQSNPGDPRSREQAAKLGISLACPCA